MNIQATIKELLQKIFAVESMQVEALPQWIAKANDFGLIKSLALHLAETKQQKVAIHAICKQLNIPLDANAVDTGLQTMLFKSERELASKTSKIEMDSSLVAAAIEVEQYEMMLYQQLTEKFADRDDLTGVLSRLYLSYEEEKQAATRLGFIEVQLARSFVAPTIPA